MDKVTIIGTDGMPKYELTEDNRILDLRYCTCSDASLPTWASNRQPYQITGTEKICSICNKPIPKENHG